MDAQLRAHLMREAGDVADPASTSAFERRTAYDDATNSTVRWEVNTVTGEAITQYQWRRMLAAARRMRLLLEQRELRGADSDRQATLLFRTRDRWAAWEALIAEFGWAVEWDSVRRELVVQDPGGRRVIV